MAKNRVVSRISPVDTAENIGSVFEISSIGHVQRGQEDERDAKRHRCSIDTGADVSNEILFTLSNQAILSIWYLFGNYGVEELLKLVLALYRVLYLLTTD